MIAVERYSHKQVGEEIGQHLDLLCTGIQQVVAKGCDQPEAIKAILNHQQ